MSCESEEEHYTHSMTKRRPTKTQTKDPLKTAEEFGIDIQALKDNLKLSYEQRIRRHQIALDAIEKLSRAKQV